MKIQPMGPNASSTAQATSRNGVARSRPATQDQAPSGAASSSVSVSLSTVHATSANADVDMERVQAIRDAIQRGELVIDVHKIADRLIHTSLELIQGSGHP